MKKFILSLFVFVSVFSFSNNVFASGVTISHDSGYLYTVTSDTPYSRIYCSNQYRDGIGYSLTGQGFTNPNTKQFDMMNGNCIAGVVGIDTVYVFGNDTWCDNHSTAECIAHGSPYTSFSFNEASDMSLTLAGVPTPVVGCMDSTANNYNSLATVDSSPTACTYTVVTPPDGGGITNPTDNAIVTPFLASIAVIKTVLVNVFSLVLIYLLIPLLLVGLFYRLLKRFIL
jgi:hypothetical protein